MGKHVSQSPPALIKAKLCHTVLITFVAVFKVTILPFQRLAVSSVIKAE